MERSPTRSMNSTGNRRAFDMGYRCLGRLAPSWFARIRWSSSRDTAKFMAHHRISESRRFVASVLLAACLAQLSSAAEAEVRGRVLDGISQEPIARVAIQAADQRTVTGDDGRFSLSTSAAELLISTVGYRPLRMKAEAGVELEIELFPQTLHRQD